MKHLPKKDQMASFQEQRVAYEAPAVIYEGVISTRAGSPLSNPSEVDGIDPDELFDE